MRSKEAILNKAKEVLKDFNKKYINIFKILSPVELKEWGTYQYNFDVWEVFVEVPQEQFGGIGLFCIAIKDDTMEPFMFHDGGAPGRVPNLKILMKDGKYVIGDEWKGE